MGDRIFVWYTFLYILFEMKQVFYEKYLYSSAGDQVG